MSAKRFHEFVVAGSREVLAQRALYLGLKIDIVDYHQDPEPKAGRLRVWDFPCPAKVEAGVLNVDNAAVVLQTLEQACLATLAGEFAALVTAPVHKAQLQQLNPNFYGHTEFFMEICASKKVVMMLADDKLRVALVTTHIPLSAVPQAITQEKIIEVIQILNQSLKFDFGINQPKIAVAGLNPHAGEQGILGHEEIDFIIPAIAALKAKGIDVTGPYPADTMFLEKNIDAFVAMYHDQGLAVLKYASFGQAANISLGLPIIRTSVDHGTALGIAGSGNVDQGSFLAALSTAQTMINARMKI
jgi:4-hydroxythreonine-4-phosphate dehydrogenase